MSKKSKLPFLYLFNSLSLLIFSIVISYNVISLSDIAKVINEENNQRVLKTEEILNNISKLKTKIKDYEKEILKEKIARCMLMIGIIVDRDGDKDNIGYNINKELIEINKILKGK